MSGLFPFLKSLIQKTVARSVLYRNHITPLAHQLNRYNVLFSQDLWQFEPWGVILQLCWLRVL